MRFKSGIIDGYTIYAVTGPNVASFAVDAKDADTRGLLGFCVYRVDPAENEEGFLYGFKVFRSVIAQPDEKTTVSTYDHPVQSFVWDDFTCKPDRIYEYRFFPAKGRPKNLLRAQEPVTIRVRTEKLEGGEVHDVFFNRGVASSQAYSRKFGNVRPDKITPPGKQAEAWEWLGRSLDKACCAFIDAAEKGDSLLGCFYEFDYVPVLRRMAAARARGVDLRLIIDGKANEHTDKEGFYESFPREASIRAMKKAGLSRKDVILRKARASALQHNKFMVLLKGSEKAPVEAWTGSTNISEGAFFGQANVGHWIRDPKVAESYRAYWELLSGDPGADGTSAASRARNAEFKRAVESVCPAPADIDSVPPGATAVFSPRSGLDVLDLYERMVDEAPRAACITLAFGIDKGLKDRLRDNNPSNALVFILMEKKDVPARNARGSFVRLSAANNTYEAWGSYIDHALYNWTRETTTRSLGLNSHVAYIHTKFLLRDPLGRDPIVVTGSANFSKPSTTENDENMLIIRGNLRAADIYFTEFNRLFNHYYFRSVQEDLARGKRPRKDDSSLFLRESDDWLEKYLPGKLRAKRVKMFVEMEGIVPCP